MSENHENSQGNGVFDGLSRRQRRAIAHLAAAPTFEKGCKSAGISPSTLTLWRRNSPAFAAALKAAEDQAFRQSLGNIQQATGDAVETLRKLLRAKGENVRLRASTELLGLAMKARESIDLEERLAVVEAKLLEKAGRFGRQA